MQIYDNISFPLHLPQKTPEISTLHILFKTTLKILPCKVEHELLCVFKETKLRFLFVYVLFVDISFSVTYVT